MEIINTNSKKLSLEEISDFEKVNDIVLPSDYKNFMLEYNGGQPVPDNNIHPPTVVRYLLGMNNESFSISLYKHIDTYKNRLPLSTFPIATDPLGNLFIMSLHPEGHGHIYFWDHEQEPIVQDGHYTDNCSFVAYSFDEFLRNLVL
jgi:hypothetical protein